MNDRKLTVCFTNIFNYACLDWRAAKLSQQRLQRCNDFRVGHAVAGDDAVAVLHVGVVVTKRLAQRDL